MANKTSLLLGSVPFAIFQDELGKHLQARNAMELEKIIFSRIKKSVYQWKLENSLQTQRRIEISLQGKKK